MHIFWLQVRRRRCLPIALIETCTESKIQNFALLKWKQNSVKKKYLILPFFNLLLMVELWCLCSFFFSFLSSVILFRKLSSHKMELQQIVSFWERIFETSHGIAFFCSILEYFLSRNPLNSYRIYSTCGVRLQRSGLYRSTVKFVLRGSELKKIYLSSQIWTEHTTGIMGGTRDYAAVTGDLRRVALGCCLAASGRHFWNFGPKL